VTAKPVLWNQLIPAVDGGYMLPAMQGMEPEIRMSWTQIACIRGAKSATRSLRPDVAQLIT
jgi:hypothetical protein